MDMECECRVNTAMRRFCSLHGAAPELLEALEDMLGQYGDEVSREVGWRKRMHDGARAAIAKARSE